MLLLSCLTLLQDTLYYTALYPILTSLVSEDEIYLFLLSYSVGFLLGTLTFYRLPLSYIVMSLSIALIQFKDVPYLVFFCIVLQGYSGGMNWMTLYMIPDYTKTGIALGFYHLGTVVGPFIGEYILYLIFGNILLFVLSFYFKHERISNDCLSELPRDPTLIHASILLFAQLVMFNGMLPVIALHLSSLNFDARMTSVYFMLPSIPNIALSVLSGYLVDRFDTKSVILIGMFWNIGCVGFFYNQFLVGMLSVAASYGWLLTTAPSLLTDTSNRLPVFIWYNCVIGIASSATPLIPLIYRHFKLQGVAFCYLIFTLIMFLVHLILWSHSDKRAKARMVQVI